VLAAAVLVGTGLALTTTSRTGNGAPGDPPVDVKVVNGSGAPVPVYDHPKITVFATKDFTLAGNGTQGAALYEVPAGKRLILEHVSALAIAPSTSDIQLPRILVTGGPGLQNHFLAWTQQPANPAFKAYSLSQPIRMYISAGSTVSIQCGFNAASGEQGNAVGAISGYLVNMPVREIAVD
jgi:hypothetical protein